MRIRKLKNILEPSSPLFTLLLITGIFICLSGAWQTAFAQECTGFVDPSAPVDECGILVMLDNEKIPPEKRSGIITGIIKKRGVYFAQTEDLVQRFKNAGADEDLIAAIGVQSAKLQKENPVFYNSYLGKKYYNLGKKYREAEQKASQLAVQARLQKNDNDAQKYEEEARKNDEEAIINADKSASYFKLVSELEPDKTIHLNNIAGAYTIAKKFDEAIDYYSQVIRIDPSAQTYINRGIAYEGKAKPLPRDSKKLYDDKAIDDYTEALSRVPKDYPNAMIPVLRYRASVYQAWGRKEEAEADLKRIDDIKNGRSVQ